MAATVKDLIALAEAHGLKSEDLDDAVHDAVSGIATRANNGGLEDQVGLLVEQWGVEATRKFIADERADA